MNLGIKPIVAGQLHQATNKNQLKNTTQNYQGTIPRLQTPKYDTVSFCAFGEGELPVINPQSSNFEYGDNLLVKSLTVGGRIHIGDNAEVEDGIVTGRDLDAGKELKTKKIEAGNSITLGANAEVEDGIKAGEDLIAKDGLKTKNIDAKGYVKLGSDAEIEDTIRCNGGLEAGDSLKTKNVISYGDVEFQSINKLENIYLYENGPKLKARRLIFNSSEIIPEKIKVILGDFRNLVIKIGGDQKDEIFKKLEFYHFDDNAINKIGAKVSKEIIAKAIKVL